ncbi:MAG: aldo/keto reductase [Cytophagales bacterium]|nr:aldo/keto reductase [Cytophagales bacterium]
MKYKLLGSSGLRVSEICLGTMTFGTEWGYGADKNISKEIFDYYLSQGGNFIDTANRYTEGTSEIYLGEFVKQSGVRDQLVIATKYSLVTQFGKINDGGNHRKNLVQSVEGSLKRLQLDYIDLLYLHAWDFTTPYDELMRALDNLVSAGKVLYIGISDTPAWIVASCNTIARLRGWSRFIALQIEYSLITRDAERDLIPMALHEGLGVVAWAPLAGGALTGKYLNLQNNDPKRLKEGSKRINERNTLIAKAVTDMANDTGYAAAHIALAWIMQKGKAFFPLVGARNVAQIQDNIRASEIILSESQIKILDEVSGIELGFPHDFLKSDAVKNVLFGGLKDNINL